MTPNDAKTESNKLKVKMNLERHAKHTRTYPPLAVGDHVKKYKKKDKLDKERKSYWSENRYEIFGKYKNIMISCFIKWLGEISY